MGGFIDIGCKPYEDNDGDRGLFVGLNRSAFDALEVLLDETLQYKHAEIYEKIMIYLSMDQIVFSELSREEFNEVIKCINKYLLNKKELTRGQLYQKDVWATIILPLMKQDERYQPD